MCVFICIIAFMFLFIFILTRMQYGATAFLLAANNGHADVIKLLLERGENPAFATEVCHAARTAIIVRTQTFF